MVKHISGVLRRSQLTPNLRRVRRWGDPIMVQYGFDVNQVGSTNFQAVKTYTKGTGFGGVTSFLRIPHNEVMRLQGMQIPDEYTAPNKMEWLCSYRGSIYMYENEADSWQTAPFVRWGTIALGGNWVNVEGYEEITIQGELWLMARLKGFMPGDWDKPLTELVNSGLVHRCYCAYRNNQFGDSPKGIVYSPLFSPQGYDFAGTQQPTHLYIAEKWLE